MLSFWAELQVPEVLPRPLFLGLNNQHLNHMETDLGLKIPSPAGEGRTGGKKKRRNEGKSFFNELKAEGGRLVPAPRAAHLRVPLAVPLHQYSIKSWKFPLSQLRASSPTSSHLNLIFLVLQLKSSPQPMPSSLQLGPLPPRASPPPRGHQSCSFPIKVRQDWTFLLLPDGSVSPDLF